MNLPVFFAQIAGLLMLMVVVYACAPDDDPAAASSKLSYTVDGTSYEGDKLTALLDTSLGPDYQILTVADLNADYNFYIGIQPIQVGIPFQPGWTLAMGPGLGTGVTMGLFEVVNGTPQITDGYNDPEGSLTITQFDRDSKVLSLTFDVKLYDRDRTESVLFKGTITELTYTVK